MEKGNLFQLGFDKKQHLVSYMHFKQLQQSTEPRKGHWRIKQNQKKIDFCEILRNILHLSYINRNP